MTPPSIQLPMLETKEGSQRQLGSLILQRDGQKISLPLGSVDVQARVVGRVAEVTVKQVFRNNTVEHLEAVYIFPLAAGSAISSFCMKVKDRVIQGVVQERAEARRQYAQALVDGKRAALMEQERDDVFTVQVGNLPPGEEVTIEIVYSERLPFFENGACELRLPLVVAPRYTPGVGLDRDNVGDGIEHDTDLVPDASRISPPRLAKGVDPQTALKLKVEILPEDGAEISDLACSQHASKASLQQGGITVSLARADERLNRDFVLRWRSASDTVKTTLVTYKAQDGETYAVLSVLPPRRDGYLGAARDVIFVLDRSGSMQGIKMSSAVSACSILLNTLGPQDRFAIASFDNTVEWMTSSRSGGEFTVADTAGIEAGEKYLRTVTARGGTEMDNALCHAFSALGSRDDKQGRVPSLVVLTDGEVGNESRILQRVQQEIGDARLFVVGIDTAVNSGLLKRLANLGGGTATFVEPGIQLEEALASIGREIGSPLVTDLRVENLDLSIDQASLSPHRVPDIFAGRASVCFFKLTGKEKGKLAIKGKTAQGKNFEQKVSAQKVDMPCIAQLWAKAHIMDLEDQYRLNPNAKPHLKKEIIDLSIRHSILTKFTAFVVVDQAEIVNKTGSLLKVVQPVEVPESWEHQDANDQLLATSTRMKSISALGGMSRKRAMFDAAASPMSIAGAAAGQDAAAAGGWADAGSAGGASDAWGAPSPQQSGSSWAPQVAAQAPTPSPQAPTPPAQPPSPGAAPQPPAAPSAKKEQSGYDAKDQDLEFMALRADASPKPKMRSVNVPPAKRPALEGFNAVNSNPVLKELPEEKEPANKPSGGALGAIQNVFEKLKSITKGEQRYANNSRISNEVRTELGSVRSALESFLQAYEVAFADMKNGTRADFAKLESARLNLLQTLATMKLGMELPRLQRFLRATAIELVSSLKDSTIAIDQLQKFWEEKQEIFNEMKQEIEDLLSGREAAFWESSV